MLWFYRTPEDATSLILPPLTDEQLANARVLPGR